MRRHARSIRSAGVRRRRVLCVAHLLMDVCSGRECAVAGAGEDHRLDVGVLFHFGDSGVHLAVEPFAKRVQHLRPVQADDADAFVFSNTMSWSSWQSLSASVFWLVSSIVLHAVRRQKRIPKVCQQPSALADQQAVRLKHRLADRLSSPAVWLLIRGSRRRLPWLYGPAR